MNAFEVERMQRSPLAACVLELSDFVFNDQLLARIWDQHRGRCYQDVLKFPDFLRLMRDALVNHGGSAHKLFVDLERTGDQPVDESNFYRKLSRTPVELSRALLREGTTQLAGLMPSGSGATLPACFDSFSVIIADGKKVKNAAKRMLPTRGYSGKLLGATALVALDARRGLALAMNDSLDAMTNDVRRVAGLMQQLHALVPGPMLWAWDRQFDDVKTMRLMAARPSDAFVVRTKQNQAHFAVESAVESTDEQGRRVLDQIGLLGQGKQTMRVRRVTLFRQEQGEDDVVLLSNLLDRAAVSAADLLLLYKERWGIERVFQQVTQTFCLSHLIGSSPRAVLLQLAFCLLLYNMMQVVKLYVAADGKVLASVVSMFYLFEDVRRELSAWAYHTEGSWPRVKREAPAMRRRLRELLKGSWDPVAYTKASDKKPRAKPKPKLRLHGGYSSVQRLLEGKVRLAKT
jgi:hypothetical protein